MPLYRHTASGTFPGEEWSFTLHTESAGSLAAAQAAWLAGVNALWTGQLDALCTASVILTEASTASINEATDRQISRLLDDVSLPGVNTSISIPPQVSCVVSLRTDLATRAGRGRFYLPPFGSDTLAAGRLSGAARGAVLAAAEALFSTIAGAGLNVVVRGRQSHVSTPVSSFNVGDVMDTQRRRRNKLIEQRASAPMP